MGWHKAAPVDIIEKTDLVNGPHHKHQHLQQLLGAILKFGQYLY
jgi:hypothetical protein